MTAFTTVLSALTSALLSALLLLTPAPPTGGMGTDMTDVPQDEQVRERILRQAPNGRFHKHGWNHYGPGYFTLDAETGVLTAHGGMGLLWYAAEEFDDFVLELEYRCDVERANAGVFLRVPGVPTSDEYIYHSFEVQINDAGEGIHTTGAVYDAEAPTKDATRPTGTWNAFRITFRGDRIIVELNGEQILDWRAEPRGKIRDFAEKGYIGLQNHDHDTSVQFRNIFITRLR